MKRFDTVVKFATTADSNKLVSSMEDYARHYMSSKYDVKGLSYETTKYSLEEKANKINETFKSELARRSKYSLEDFNNDIQEYATYGVVAQMAANIQKVMLDTVTPIVTDAMGLSTLSNIQYGGYGDVFEFELVDNSIYEVSRMGRRQKHTRTQTKKASTKTIATDMYGITTITNLPEILVGDSMFAEDVMLKAISMVAKIYQLVIGEFTTVSEAMTDENLVLENFDETEFLKKLRLASARNGAKMVIVGDAVALKSVLPAEARTRILLGDEYNTVGYMSVFNGYTVLGFNVVSDGNDGVVGLPTNRIYALPVNGSKLIQVAIGYTSTNTDEDYDNNNLAILSTLRKELGVSLATNKKIVKVKLAG